MECIGEPLPQSCCYYGTGRVYLAGWLDWQNTDLVGNQEPFVLARDDGGGVVLPLAITSAMRDIGEAARLDIDVRTKSNSLQRYDGCGGEQCATEQLEGIDITLGIDCLSIENLALAFAANTSASISQTSTQTAQRLNALVQCARTPMALLFEAINVMDGSMLLVFIPKVKFSIAKNRRFISDDFGEITLTGRVLHAGSVGPGHSPWWDETTVRCLPQSPAPALVFTSSIQLTCQPEGGVFLFFLSIQSQDPTGTYEVTDAAGETLTFPTLVDGATFNPRAHFQLSTPFYLSSVESIYIAQAAGQESLIAGQTWTLTHLESGTVVSTAVVPLCTPIAN